ncbi:MAG: 3-oxoacyl-[acyl-carrier-protein] reductase [Betaproteobacteria bacterium]
MFDMTGKTALVTGATGGIGAAIAKALHKAGATVAISGTRAAVLEELKAELGGDRVHVIPCNLSDASAVEKLVPEAEAAMGSLDILVNNAGITKDGLAMRMKDDDWNAVIDVNLTASFRLARAAMRGMMKKRWGRIVNITSVVGVTGNPGQANYVASKAGVIGLTKSLAQELAARSVTVNAVAPGFIATPILSTIPDKVMAQMTDRVPMKRLGQPEEIASVYAFLASDDASYINGAVIEVAGGLTV